MEGLVLGRRKDFPVINGGERDWRHNYICGCVDRTSFGAPLEGFFFLKDNEIKSPPEVEESEGV